MCLHCERWHLYSTCLGNLSQERKARWTNEASGVSDGESLHSENLDNKSSKRHRSEDDLTSGSQGSGKWRRRKQMSRSKKVSSESAGDESDPRASTPEELGDVLPEETRIGESSYWRYYKKPYIWK